jgi:hypothetical protein
MSAMGRIRALAGLLAGLLLVAPASAGTGSELRAVIARAEQLRGLKTTHPLAISTLDAAGLRRGVVGGPGPPPPPRHPPPGGNARAHQALV